MTLQEFKDNPDWRMTFDVAFGLGQRDMADPEYYGPILAVKRVLMARRGGNKHCFAFAVVEFDKGCSPEPYALVYSQQMGKDLTGDVVYYSQAPTEVISNG